MDWYTELYDDSSWSNALTIPEHSDYTVEYLRENFGLYAKLLWYYDEGYIGSIYCRARLAYGERPFEIGLFRPVDLPLFLAKIFSYSSVHL